MSATVLYGIGMATPKNLHLLTKNEWRVLALYGRGHSIKEIAVKFGNSPKTIESWKERTVKKLRIKTATYPKIAFKAAAGLL